jgi:DNA polymerase-4
LPKDTRSISVISETINTLSAKLADKLRKKHIVSYELSVMIRYKDWETVTRQQSLDQPLYQKNEINKCALNLFRKNWKRKPVRLIGVTLAAFKPLDMSTKQLDLFTYEQDAEKEPIVRLVAQMNEKFGAGTLKSAAVLFNDGELHSTDHSHQPKHE